MDLKNALAYDYRYMTQHEGLPTAAQGLTPEVGQVLTPMQAGIIWLEERGVDLETASIQIVGPFPECNGTLAEMVGQEGHVPMKDSVELAINEAKTSGREVSEAVTDGLRMFAKRDDSGEIVRQDVSSEQVKKKT